MKKKYFSFAVVPILTLALLGAGTASAHGMLGFGQAAQNPEQFASQRQAMFQKEAELLGVSVDEVKNAWAAGKTLEQLAQEKGITKDQLKTKMQELRNKELSAQLQALVSKGVITQAQADARLQFMKNHQQEGKGKRGGFRMHF